MEQKLFLPIRFTIIIRYQKAEQEIFDCQDGKVISRKTYKGGSRHIYFRNRFFIQTINKNKNESEIIISGEEYLNTFKHEIRRGDVFTLCSDWDIFNFTNNGKYLIVDELISERFISNSVVRISDGQFIKKIEIPELTGDYAGLYRYKISNNLQYYLEEVYTLGAGNIINLVNEKNLDKLICITYDYLVIDCKFSMDNRYLVLLQKDRLIIYYCHNGEIYFNLKRTYDYNDVLFQSVLGRFFLTASDPNLGTRSHYYINIRQKKLDLINNYENYPDYVSLDFFNPLLEKSHIVFNDTIRKKHYHYDCEIGSLLTGEQFLDGYIFDYNIQELVMPWKSIVKSLVIIRILRKTLAAKYPKSLPLDIIREITAFLLLDLISIAPISLSHYMVECAGRIELSEEEFIEGFYSNCM